MFWTVLKIEVSKQEKVKDYTRVNSVSTWVHKRHYWTQCSCKHSYEPAWHVKIGKMSVESYDFERLGYVQVGF